MSEAKEQTKALQQRNSGEMSYDCVGELWGQVKVMAVTWPSSL
jgi:hypothetical protein